MPNDLSFAKYSPFQKQFIWRVRFQKKSFYFIHTIKQSCLKQDEKSEKQGKIIYFMSHNIIISDNNFSAIDISKRKNNVIYQLENM